MHQGSDSLQRALGPLLDHFSWWGVRDRYLLHRSGQPALTELLRMSAAHRMDELVISTGVFASRGELSRHPRRRGPLWVAGVAVTKAVLQATLLKTTLTLKIAFSLEGRRHARVTSFHHDDGDPSTALHFEMEPEGLSLGPVRREDEWLATTSRRLTSDAQLELLDAWRRPYDPDASWLELKVGHAPHPEAAIYSPGSRPRLVPWERGLAALREANRGLVTR